MSNIINDSAHGDICDLFTDSTDLKEECLEALNQQQLPSVLDVPHDCPTDNVSMGQWAADDMATNSHEGYIHSSDDMQHVSLPMNLENGLASSMSLPSYITGNVVNSIPAVKPSEKKKKKRAVLSEAEEELLKKSDTELNEKELLMKKKAQNRLAQRAFRERKEERLKELEKKLLQSEEERQILMDTLEEIKLQYILIRKENNLLRSAAKDRGNTGGVNLDALRFVFPESQREFINEMVQGPHVIQEAHINRVYDEPQKPGLKVLAVGAVWDYLHIKVEEEEFQNVDLLEVMALLKGHEKCHGYGPAYLLDLVDSVLRHVAARSA